MTDDAVSNKSEPQGIRSYFDGKMWRAVLRDVWKLFQRYPILAVWPFTLYLRLFEPDTLNQMVEEALGERRQVDEPGAP